MQTTVEPSSTEERPEPELDAELLFLLLQHLRNTPCTSAAHLLEQEAVQAGLLPTRTDIHGKQAVQ